MRLNQEHPASLSGSARASRGVSMADILGAHSRLRGLQGMSDDGGTLLSGSLVTFPEGTQLHVRHSTLQQPYYDADVTLTTPLICRTELDQEVHASGVGYANDEIFAAVVTGGATANIDADNVAVPVLEGTTLYIRPNDEVIVDLNTDFLLSDPPVAYPVSTGSTDSAPPPRRRPATTRTGGGLTMCEKVGIGLLLGGGLLFAGWAMTR